MATSLNSFVNRLAGGGARANQFRVTLSGFTVDSEALSFLCRTAQMPGLTVGEVTVPYRGRQVFVAGDRTYDAWTVTVFNDANWSIRASLEAWMNHVTNIGSTSGASPNPRSYYGEALVQQKDRNDETIWSGKLYDVWPTVLDPVEFAYDTNDIIEEYGVTFRFNYMTTGIVGTGIGSS